MDLQLSKFTSLELHGSTAYVTILPVFVTSTIFFRSNKSYTQYTFNCLNTLFPASKNVYRSQLSVLNGEAGSP